MDMFKDKKSFLIAPVAWVACMLVLLAVWWVMEPAALVRLFDAEGYSPIELATLPFFAAIVPVVWWKCPFEGSKRRRTLLCASVSLVAVMAIVKETDLHNMALHALFPSYVGDDGLLIPGVLTRPNGKPLTGTPFKLRVLTNGGVPFAMKVCVTGYFAALFGVFAAGFAYLFKNWVLGVFKLAPSAWAVGCFGASGLMVQVTDRLPSWLGHTHGLSKSASGITAAQSLCTALEEGGEMMIAIFAILAIVLAHRAVQQRV